MSRLRWTADGIRVAEEAGGVTLEVYFRPGFTGGKAVRRSGGSVYAEGFDDGHDPDPDDHEPAERIAD